MADSALLVDSKTIPVVDGNQLVTDVSGHFDVEDERLKAAVSPGEDNARIQGLARNSEPSIPLCCGNKDAVDDALQTIRISNAASSHWLAMGDDSASPPAVPVSDPYNGTDVNATLLEEHHSEAAKSDKVAAEGQEGDSLQSPHCWRKRLKPISCQENGEIKREPRKDSEHVPEKCLKDRRLSRDDHAEEAKARSDRIRISPSAKKELAVVRGKGQLSPNLTTLRGVRRGSKSQLDSESAFTRQVVKPMKSSVIQKNRTIYPTAYMVTKNIPPPFFSGKKMSSSHQLDACGSSGQVSMKMVEKVMKARLYLLQQTGPNSFLIGGDSPDHKYRVIIGPQKCSCGREVFCIHLLFVMLRVFQVPQNDPILSRKPLKNYEVEALFRNYHARRTSRLKDNTKKKTGCRMESKDFNRSHSKIKSAEDDEEEDDEDDDDDTESVSTIGQDDDGIEKEEEEDICSICLLTMVDGESLTECKTGCQNRLHHHCIAIWFEECRRQKEPLICPLCRAEWKNKEGETAVSDTSPDLALRPVSLAVRESSPQGAVNEVDITSVEPLTPEQREMAEKCIPIFGEEIIVRLFSKNWSVREAALRLLSQEAVGVLLLGVGEGRSGVLVSPERQANNHTMLECCCSILAISLYDPVYKVFVSGLRALRMILSYTPCRDEVQQSRLQSLLKPVVKSLLLKCADSNRKTSQLSISALEELVKGQDGELAVGREIVNPGNQGLGGIGYVIDCIVENDAVGNLHWQWVLGRFCMLERLLEEYSHEFAVSLPPDHPEYENRGLDGVTGSANYKRAFSVLRFCTFHMSFAHIKVSKMARRVFYCITRLQLHHTPVFEKACLLLNDVDVTIQGHMKRKLFALIEDYRMPPSTKAETNSSVPSPAASSGVSNGLMVLPQVNITASSPVTDVMTFVVADAVSFSSRKVSSGTAENGTAVDEVEMLRSPMYPSSCNTAPSSSERLLHLSPVMEETSKSGAEMQQRQLLPRVEYADACVSTSPLPLQSTELWNSKRMADDPAFELNAFVYHTENNPESNGLDISQVNKTLIHAANISEQDNAAECLSRPNQVIVPSNTSFAMCRSMGSKESLSDRLGAAFSSSQVSLLTEDLSDLLLSSSSAPEEKVSFKTEVATTPHNSPQRSANNTADDGCHCKEEVEKEEAEALVEALERSDLPQDALPHVPGLSRGKSETTLTIHMQDKSPGVSEVDGFDSTHQYQEGFHWRRGPVLGTGAFSTCYQARDNRTGTLMAVKQISFCRNTLSEQEKVINAVKEEIHILGRLSHPNIIRILGATQQGCHFFMFVEWMPGCSLATLLDRYGSFSEQVITSYTLQVLRGLAYLHDNQVLHRDLKGANLLVDSTGHRVRIGDFGAAARLATRMTGAGEFEGQLLGTIAFMAPEVLRGDTYGRKCDMWSFGCTMVEMATAQPPWGANDISNHLALIFKIASTVHPPPIPENLSPAIRDVMLRCLEVNPEDRPVAKDLLKHPLFRT